MKDLQYYCDKARHLVCVPYSVENLHKMAKDLDIKKVWFHKNHYDIPKRRIAEITAKCTVVSSKDIVNIIKGNKVMNKFNELYEGILTEGKAYYIYVWDGEDAVDGLLAAGAKGTKMVTRAGEDDEPKGFIPDEEYMFDHDILQVDLKYKKIIFDWLIEVGYELDEIDKVLGGKRNPPTKMPSYN